MSLVAADQNDLKAGEHMKLAQKRFLCTCSEDLVPAQEKAALKAELLAAVKEHNMLAFYVDACSDAEMGWTLDSDLKDKLEKEQESRLVALKEKLENARKNDGEVEILDAIVSSRNGARSALFSGLCAMCFFC